MDDHNAHDKREAYAISQLLASSYLPVVVLSGFEPHYLTYTGRKLEFHACIYVHVRHVKDRAKCHSKFLQVHMAFRPILYMTGVG